MTRITKGGEQFHFASYSDEDQKWIVGNQRFVLNEEPSIAAVNGVFLSDLWYGVSGNIQERKYLIIQSSARKIPVQEFVSRLNKTLNNYKNSNEMEKIVNYLLTKDDIVLRCAYFTLEDTVQSKFITNNKSGDSDRIVAKCRSSSGSEEMYIQLDLHAVKLPTTTDEEIYISNPEIKFMY